MIKKRKARILIYLLVSACIVVPLYILCHEAGHAAVAYFCGADTIHISITGAYMNSSGGSYNRVTSAMLNIAGMLFPAVISIIYLLLYKREKGSLFYRLFSFLLVAAFSMPAAAWILVPVLYMLGKAPVGDDVTKFLDVTGMNPVILILLAAGLLAASIFLAWRKGIIRNYWEELRKVEQV